VQIQELIDEYRKKTDNELMLLERDREHLTLEAVSALTDELSRRRITGERIREFSRKEDRQARKEGFRSKRRRARAAEGWWLKIQLVAAFGIGLLAYYLLPFKVPKDWEDAAFVTFLCTVGIGFTFREFWKRISFWVSLVTSAVAQLWVIKAVNPRAHWHHKDASIVTGLAVGFLIWGAMYWLLRSVRQGSEVRSEYRHD
jgi:hypothetical protein